MKHALVPGAVLAGALLFAWPALLNGYPLMFSDTWGYLDQGYEGVSWDKPWVYGPFIRALHWGRTLWPVVAVQCLLLSSMLWLLQHTLLPPIPAPAPARLRVVTHLLLCLVLAAVSAAPWFASQVMPDSFTPLCVMGIAILALGHARLSRLGRVALVALTAFLVASHFSHVAIAAACIAAVAILRWRTLLRDTWRPAVALAAALAFILATNVVGRGQFAISPAGPVFILARLVADGPAAAYLDRVCPAAGYHLCEWKGRFPTDSDAFLWSSDGPLYKDDYGAPRLAPEAAEIVRRTVMAYPGPVVALALRNTLKQLTMVRLGDAIAPDYLASVLRDTVAAYFPSVELARFDRGLQVEGRLRPIGEALNPVLVSILVVGALASILLATTGWRRHPTLAAFAAIVLTAVCANAATTGALSTPHDRYEARVAWLVLLPPAFLVLSRHRTRLRMRYVESEVPLGAARRGFLSTGAARPSGS